MKKILIVFGTRPEAIKMAPLVKEFQKYPDTFEIRVCVTAQHREMLDQVLDLFEITPEYDLNIMKSGQDLYDITSNVLLGIKSILNDFKPDIVLVHGDTSTTVTASLAAYYHRIKVGHVEAGLRTNDIYSPWPEEVNRQVVGVIASYHFAPTQESKYNLLKENKKEEDILVCGNSVIDALFLALKKIENSQELQQKILYQLSVNNYQLQNDKKIILVTGHRRESFGQGFINICEALMQIALDNPEVDIVYPVHLNPNVQEPVQKILGNIKNIYLIEPLSYEKFIYLMKASYFIITDSGGVQEEAPSLCKPVLVTRNTTERPEAISSGMVKLVGTSKNKIVQECSLLLNNENIYTKMSQGSNPYGDGKACEKIINFLKEEIN